MTDPAFDAYGLFDEDYLHFYVEQLEEHAEAEADLLWRLLELEPGREVLDLACGHGRIANRLAGRGCRLTGLDTTPLFLERARSDAAARGVSVTYIEGDMRLLPWDDERFDRVINMFTAFGYFDDADNRRVLAEIARVLRPGGRLAMELNNRDWLIRNFQPASVVDRAGDLMIDQRRLDPLTGRIITERIMVRQGQVRRIPFFVRLFTFTEMRDWLLAAGFATVHGYGGDGAPLALESPRMIMVAER
ncbi:MAG TPA: methyltransferase domain-containing protein [Streptosporangiaceae bacterium]|jgi:SAM-dependent methyltransferase|nr:methyltransferase domain-containing protein [Streptosporangiaceae bacterium]